MQSQDFLTLKFYCITVLQMPRSSGTVFIGVTELLWVEIERNWDPSPELRGEEGKSQQHRQS